MTLAALKTALQTLTGTHIGSVHFDWKKYENEIRSKTYPVVLWSLDGAKKKADRRASTIQKNSFVTITAFMIGKFNISTDDKITVWDTLESQFEEYLNAMNDGSRIQILNIANIEGTYIPEGMISADIEIGLMFQGVVIKTFC